MKCKHCGSQNTFKTGTEYQASGDKQRVKCKDCGRISLYVVSDER